MFVANELSRLMVSDVSSAAIDQIITKPALWVTISACHFLGGFFGFHAYFHLVWAQGPLSILLVLYALLQIVQLWSPGVLGFLLLDGAWDILSVGTGIALAWFWASAGVKAAPSHTKEDAE